MSHCLGDYEFGNYDLGVHEISRRFVYGQEIERAGDHVKNMAEEVCHLVSRRTIRHVLRGYDRPVEQLFLDHIKCKQ